MAKYSMFAFIGNAVNTVRLTSFNGRSIFYIETGILCSRVQGFEGGISLVLAFILNSQLLHIYLRSETIK
jgi:tetrahydromethanopterin S-methyltransferase subunit B